MMNCVIIYLIEIIAFRGVKCMTQCKQHIIKQTNDIYIYIYIYANHFPILTSNK